MKNKPDFREALHAWSAAQPNQSTPLDPSVAEAFRAGTLSETERMTVLEQVMGDDDQLQELLHGSLAPDQEPLSEAHIQASWESFQQRLQDSGLEPPAALSKATPRPTFLPAKLLIWQAAAATFFVCALLFSFQWMQEKRNTFPTSTTEASVRDIYFDQDVRSSEADKLPAKANTLRLYLAPTWPSYRSYAVEILNAKSEKVEDWVMAPDANGVLTITIWTEDPDNWKTYSLNIYGLSDMEKKKLGEKNLILSSIES